MKTDIGPSIGTTMAAPQVLFVNHFKAIKLPTFARKYEKVGANCADDAEPEQILGAGVGRL